MADNPIKHSDIIQPGDPFDDTIKGLEKMIKLLKQAAKDYLKFAQKQNVATKEGQKNIQNLASATKQLSIKEKEALKIKQQLEREQAKLNLMTSKEFKELVKTKEAARAKNAELRNAAKAMRTGAKTTNTWGKALGSFAFKFNALGNIAANVASKLTRTFSRAMRGAIKTIMAFEQAMADVRAVTNPTDKDFKKLSKSARDLGGATKFTAIEVSKLQKELGKLGLTTQEILNAQAAVLDLAAATGAELPRAAEVAGITLRQFGLNASEMRRVVDVMAQSFRTSPLDIEKFAESMKFVGPVAKKVGFTLEETTARLAQMAKAGISGSLGGTALRMIFIQLAKTGKDVSAGLRELTMEELGLADAVEAVKVRAATALTVLADSAGVMDEYTESLNRATGASQEMANIQIATLQGQVTILKSSWDRYILSLAESEEQFIVLKAVLKGTSLGLNEMATNVEENKEESTKFHTALKGLWRGVKGSIPIWGTQVVQLEQTKKMLIENKESADELKTAFDALDKSVGGVSDFFKDVAEVVKKDTIKAFSEQLKKLKEQRLDASLSEIGAINREIAALQEKIKLYKALGIAVPIEEIKEFSDEEIKLEEVSFDRKKNIFQENRKFILASRKRFAAEDEAAKKAEEEAAAKVEKEKQTKIQATFDFASRLTSTFTDLFASQKAKELSAVGDNAEKRLEIEKKFAKKEQILAISSAIIDGASAIMKTQAQLGWPLALPFMIASAALSAAQIGIIASQKFEEGGPIIGESHSRGGVNVEAEGGEYIINKRSTSKYGDLIQAINTNDSASIANAALQNEAFHDVWSRAGMNNVAVMNSFDPYIKKMYEIMLNTPQVGPYKDRIEYYPNGKTRIING